MRRPLSTHVKTKQPQMALYGILGPASEVFYDESDAWTSAFTYDTPDGRIAVVVGDARGTVEHTVVENPNAPVAREYVPFMVRVNMYSSSFANDYDEIRDIIDPVLNIALQKAIEREFWLGTASTAVPVDDYKGTRWLDDNSAVRAEVVTGTPVKAGLGLALIEQALADATIGTQGTIHMPRAVASTIGLDNDDKTLLTNLQTPVIAGTGYQMNDAKTAWIFGTGPITVRHGKPVVLGSREESFDRKNNTFNLTLEIPVAVTWSTTELQAVLVDLSLEE